MRPSGNCLNDNDLHMFVPLSGIRIIGSSRYAKDVTRLTIPSPLGLLKILFISSDFHLVCGGQYRFDVWLKMVQQLHLFSYVYVIDP